MPSAEDARALRQALALGLLQGPAELLPVSSSAHTALIPWLAGWSYASLDGEQRKAFEVALHAGAGLALTIHMRRELLREATCIDAQRAQAIALALAPPALAGYVLRGPIERRLGGPRSIAFGLLAGAAAMAIADTRAATNAEGDARAQQDATPRDGLALGLAQAAALVPGVSRNGATLSAARARGFARDAAQALSWHAGIPVLFGASLLKGARMRRSAIPRGQRTTLAVGAAGAFVSTLASARVLDRTLREGAPLWPYSLYRCVLAALVCSRLRDPATRTPTNP
jgi:undecaprenyl-diphosphatase